MRADELKTRLKAAQEHHSEHSRIRLHRAISWLARAERETDDPDARFIFQWIAFNAAYARQFGTDAPERERFSRFLRQLVAHDQVGQLKASVFGQFSGPIRVLIDNPYVFEPFWVALRDHDASEQWNTRFESAKRAALTSVMTGQTGQVLGIVFDRLYVLRNQLLHGGATWNSKVNRQQIRDGAQLMGTLLPVILAILIDQPELDTGEILYPVVG